MNTTMAQENRDAKAERIRELRRFKSPSLSNNVVRKTAELEFGNPRKLSAFERLGLRRSEYADNMVSVSYCDDDGECGGTTWLLDGPWLNESDDAIFDRFNLHYRYGGPGRAYSRGHFLRSEHSILVKLHWGLDI